MFRALLSGQVQACCSCVQCAALFCGSNSEHYVGTAGCLLHRAQCRHLQFVWVTLSDGIRLYGTCYSVSPQLATLESLQVKIHSGWQHGMMQFAGKANAGLCMQ